MPDHAPPRLDQQAAENLRFIRDTMARAADFTAVPGWGGALMGSTAIVAALVAGPPRESGAWLSIWLVDAGVAAAIGVVATARKAWRSGIPLGGAAMRRFTLAFVPPLAAGAVLTAVFVRDGLIAKLPGCWLLCYGAAVAAGGAFSVPLVPVMGVAFMGLGVLAFLAPAYGSLFMAAGFGALQIGFGMVIARRYGG
jgi:hypothetical protein